jgi:hypothetical protein
MKAKHSMGAIVTACMWEKNPNPTPATLPNAKCGNLAVPPETGYIAPSSAWHRARMMITTPAMSQAMTAAPPTACAANSAPNSQPEPIIDVSDAQVAPTSPSSRLRPTSVGRVTTTPDVSVAMSDPFPVVPRGAGPVGPAAAMRDLFPGR